MTSTKKTAGRRPFHHRAFPLVPVLSGIGLAVAGLTVNSHFVADRIYRVPHLNPLDAFFVRHLDMILISAGLMLFLCGIYLFICWKSPGGRAELFSGGAVDYESEAAGARAFDLFLISFLVLFMELAFIRWIPAYVRLLSYFSNFILLACFLGFGLGCLLSRRRGNLMAITPAAVFTIVAVTLILHITTALSLFLFTAGDIGTKETVYFGNTFLFAPPSPKLPMEIIISFVFVAIAVAFMGPGQILGRTMSQFQPIRAYAINICGSIAGILAFLLVAFLEIPAPAWFLLGFLGILWFLRKQKKWHLVVQVAILAAGLGFTSFVDRPPSEEVRTLWSPYYKVVYWHPRIAVNETGHQKMLRSNHPDGRYYSLPYLLQKAATGKGLDSALIIGAGSGNDVAHALLNGVKEIDAVEIDPVIQRIGKTSHPDRPYSDEKVRGIIDDGRSFLRKTDKKYDVVVYALVDSLTLLSTYSSVRLETFLFTREAFADVREHLNEDGIFVMYNYFRESWLMLRLYKMLEDAFGEEPILLLDPPAGHIEEGQKATVAFSVFIAGNTGAVKENFEKYGTYKIHAGNMSRNLGVNGFTLDPGPENDVIEYFPPSLGAFETDIPTDDWPFLYLRNRTIPRHNVKGLLLVLILSLVLYRIAGAGSGGRLNFHFFFLGSAFMVLETESITKLALLYGSTWLVNSIVFLSVLVMVFMANAYILRFPVKRIGFVYAALFASVALNYLVPLRVFLGAHPVVEYGVSNLIIFMPIVFAGIIFSSMFRRSRDTSGDFGSNLLGIIVGGVCEYASLATGYQNLLIIVAAMYLLSLVFLPRRPAARIA